MTKIIRNISSLVTMNTNGSNRKINEEMNDVGEIKNGALIFDDKIIFAGTEADADLFAIENNITFSEVIDADQKCILPGFVDSHTHIVFGGNRSDEFAKRLRGWSYQQIAAEGGGILKTMNATRSATVDELFENGKELAYSAIRYGTTAIEIKSGYGLTTESEFNQLAAIKKLKETLPIEVSATFLGAHDFPPEYAENRDDYVDLICSEMIPAVAAGGLAEYVDAFVDKGYYTLDQAEKIFAAALKYGLKTRVHADELADVGAAGLAAKLKSVSADHLLFISDSGISSLAESGTVATLLPGTAYFIRMPYAPARKLIESNVLTALATDCNPGSCFTENMQIILSLAVINMKMTAEEALAAATINGAAALGKSDRMGSLEAGKLANFVLLDCTSYVDLFYHFGINHVSETWINGIKFSV